MTSAALRVSVKLTQYSGSFCIDQLLVWSQSYRTGPWLKY